MSIEIGLCDKGQKSNLQTLSFTAERNEGNCYEHTKPNE